MIEATIVLFYVLYCIIKLLRPSAIIIIEKEIRKDKDVLSIFSKPERLTVEEVSISIEKKICLVCKNTLARDIYLCPKCYAFYCKDCSTVLANRENACWVCNAPFDTSKPVRILESPIQLKDKNKAKKIALITIIDKSFSSDIEKFEWNETEKEEFIQYMLSISPARRIEILNEMKEMSNSLTEKESHKTEGDL